MSIRNITGGKSGAVSKLLNIIGMAMAFAAVLLVTVAVVTLRSLSAALSDPVESLRSE